MRVVASILALLAGCFSIRAQISGIADGPTASAATRNVLDPSKRVTVSVGVRDSRGLPLEDQARISLSARSHGFNQTIVTERNSMANFPGILQGAYDLEVQCPGYVAVVKHLEIVVGSDSNLSVYIYLRSLNESTPSKRPYTGLVLTPELAKVIDKGLALMHKQQFDEAKIHFARADRISPGSTYIAYLQGTAELALANKEAARHDFQLAVDLDPYNEKALLSLGELQLQSGDTSAGIATLTQAYTSNGAGWRTQYLLATAYLKTGNLAEAETFANRSAKLVSAVNPAPILLLGNIQELAGKRSEAARSWDLVIANYPDSAEAGEARRKIKQSSSRSEELPTATARGSALASNLPMPRILDDGSWAPPDIDSKGYPVAPSVACDTEAILFQASDRLKSQLGNLEKFGATEHIEHQEIDKNGLAGPPKFNDFYYLVFVIPDRQNAGSVYLEESRNGGLNISNFPTSLATTGLNGLGINVLLPTFRYGFDYQCEGLTNVRGEAAWQLRFEEKKDAKLNVRQWSRNGKIHNVPVKGRVWLSSTSYDLLRVETDLREPIAELELSRDHLEVEYGPVNFLDGKSQLWLPWNAEMYMELHGRRYHHKHVLSNYLLFGVDTSNKINKPKGAIPNQKEGTKAGPEEQHLKEAAPP